MPLEDLMLVDHHALGSYCPFQNRPQARIFRIEKHIDGKILKLQTAFLWHFSTFSGFDFCACAEITIHFYFWFQKWSLQIRISCVEKHVASSRESRHLKAFTVFSVILLLRRAQEHY